MLDQTKIQFDHLHELLEKQREQRKHNPFLFNLHKLHHSGRHIGDLLRRHEDEETA